MELMVQYAVKSNTGTVYPQKWGIIPQRAGVLYTPSKNKHIVYKKNKNSLYP
jgi:hypothetical protein